MLRKAFVKRVSAAVCLGLLLCALMSGAAAELSGDTKALVAEKTDEMIDQMLALGRSERYLQLYGVTNADPALGSRVREIISADWTECSGGTAFILKDGALDAVLTRWLDCSISDFTSPAKEVIEMQAVILVPEIVLANYASIFNDERLGDAAHVLKAETFFAASGFPRLMVVIMRNNAQYDVICTFVSTEDEAVYASLTPVPAGLETSLRQTLGLSALYGDPSRLYEEAAIDPEAGT